MQQAAQILKDSVQPLTRRMIAEAVGMSPDGLKKYSRVKVFLDQLTRREKGDSWLFLRLRWRFSIHHDDFFYGYAGKTDSLLIGFKEVAEDQSICS